MFIRKKRRASSRGIVIDLYVVVSRRTEKGPRAKVLGYLGCFREGATEFDRVQRSFWAPEKRKNVEERIAGILAMLPIEKEGLKRTELKKLVKACAKIVPRPRKPAVV